MDVQELAGMISESVIETFETQIFMEPTQQGFQETRDQVLSGEYISTVYISGHLNGMVAMVCPKAAAMGMTRNMLGMTDEEVAPSDVGDCVGEVVNIVTGSIKKRCVDRGMDFGLSIPTVVSGRDLLVKLQDPVRGVRVTFVIEDSDVGFWVLLRELSDGALDQS